MFVSQNKLDRTKLFEILKSISAVLIIVHCISVTTCPITVTKGRLNMCFLFKCSNNVNSFYWSPLFGTPTWTGLHHGKNENEAITSKRKERDTSKRNQIKERKWEGSNVTFVKSWAHVLQCHPEIYVHIPSQAWAKHSSTISHMFRQLQITARLLYHLWLQLW